MTNSAFRSEKGQGVVEFALILPFLLALGTGVVSFGLAFAYKNHEVHLANEAARYMVVNRCPVGCGAQTVNQYVLAHTPSKDMRDHAVITVSFEQAGGVPVPFNHCQTGDHPLTVTVTWPDYVLLPMFNAIHKDLGASVTMRIERDWIGNPVTGKASPPSVYDVEPGSASNDVCPVPPPPGG